MTRNEQLKRIRANQQEHFALLSSLILTIGATIVFVLGEDATGIEFGFVMWVSALTSLSIWRAFAYDGVCRRSWGHLFDYEWEKHDLGIAGGD